MVEADLGLPARRPMNSIGGGLQHERTALAWERTAISMMVAGVVLARFGAQEVHVAVGFFGIAETVAGASLLLWAGRHDDELHSPATPPDSVPQVTLTRVIGSHIVVFSAVALAVVVVHLLNEGVWLTDPAVEGFER
ncbi:MAG: DUF202 domain-containing protein [Acidimicrobiales bacterium]|nr:DUF202 domain-containing protein [Acidimicrobiales bacterium]MDG2219348.1 DUF202 domain-containing protein [Acidimicrobiales bacterium]